MPKNTITFKLQMLTQKSLEMVWAVLSFSMILLPLFLKFAKDKYRLTHIDDSAPALTQKPSTELSNSRVIILPELPNGLMLEPSDALFCGLTRGLSLMATLHVRHPLAKTAFMLFGETLCLPGAQAASISNTEVQYPLLEMKASNLSAAEVIIKNGTRIYLAIANRSEIQIYDANQPISNYHDASLDTPGMTLLSVDDHEQFAYLFHNNVLTQLDIHQANAISKSAQLNNLQAMAMALTPNGKSLFLANAASNGITLSLIQASASQLTLAKKFTLPWLSPNLTPPTFSTLALAAPENDELILQYRALNSISRSYETGLYYLNMLTQTPLGIWVKNATLANNEFFTMFSDMFFKNHRVFVITESPTTGYQSTRDKGQAPGLYVFDVNRSATNVSMVFTLSRYSAVVSGSDIALSKNATRALITDPTGAITLLDLKPFLGYPFDFLSTTTDISLFDTSFLLKTRPTLIASAGKYYLYGNTSSNFWRLTELDQTLVSQANLPSPTLNGNAIMLTYDATYDPLYKEVATKQAHTAPITNGSSLIDSIWKMDTRVTQASFFPDEQNILVATADKLVTLKNEPTLPATPALNMAATFSQGGNSLTFYPPNQFFFPNNAKITSVQLDSLKQPTTFTSLPPLTPSVATSSIRKVSVNQEMLYSLAFNSLCAFNMSQAPIVIACVQASGSLVDMVPRHDNSYTYAFASSSNSLLVLSTRTLSLLYTHSLASILGTSSTMHISQDEQTLYLTGAAGVLAYQFTNATHIQIMSTIPISNSATICNYNSQQQVLIMSYVQLGLSYAAVIDVSNANSIKMIASMPINCVVKAIKTTQDGLFFFMACQGGFQGIRMYALADKTKPVLLFEFPILTFSPESLLLLEEENLLFVSSTTKTLAININPSTFMPCFEPSQGHPTPPFTLVTGESNNAQMGFYINPQDPVKPYVQPVINQTWIEEPDGKLSTLSIAPFVNNQHDFSLYLPREFNRTTLKLWFQFNRLFNASLTFRVLPGTTPNPTTGAPNTAIPSTLTPGSTPATAPSSMTTHSPSTASSTQAPLSTSAPNSDPFGTLAPSVSGGTVAPDPGYMVTIMGTSHPVQINATGPAETQYTVGIQFLQTDIGQFVLKRLGRVFTEYDKATEYITLTGTMLDLNLALGNLTVSLYDDRFYNTGTVKLGIKYVGASSWLDMRSLYLSAFKLNHAPLIMGALPNQTFARGKPITINLQQSAFLSTLSDPEGDAIQWGGVAMDGETLSDISFPLRFYQNTQEIKGSITDIGSFIITLIASDGYKQATISSFSLMIRYIPPAVREPLPSSIIVKPGVTSSFEINPLTFSGESLQYEAMTEAAEPLPPEWLQFNPLQLKLTATYPKNENIEGLQKILILACDPYECVNASTSLRIYDAPPLVKKIWPPFSIQAGKPNSSDISKNTCMDPDDDVLQYAVTQDDDIPLSNGLSWDEERHTLFYNLPASRVNETLHLTISCSDGVKKNKTALVINVVAPPPPIKNDLPSDIMIYLGEGDLSFELSQGFTAQPGYTLTYTIRSEGEERAIWVKINENTGHAYGIPTDNDVERACYIGEASDSYNRVQQKLCITVKRTLWDEMMHLSDVWGPAASAAGVAFTGLTMWVIIVNILKGKNVMIECPFTPTHLIYPLKELTINSDKKNEETVKKTFPTVKFYREMQEQLSLDRKLYHVLAKLFSHHLKNHAIREEVLESSLWLKYDADLGLIEVEIKKLNTLTRPFPIIVVITKPSGIISTEFRVDPFLFRAQPTPSAWQNARMSRQGLSSTPPPPPRASHSFFSTAEQSKKKPSVLTVPDRPHRNRTLYGQDSPRSRDVFVLNFNNPLQRPVTPPQRPGKRTESPTL